MSLIKFSDFGDFDDISSRLKQLREANEEFGDSFIEVNKIISNSLKSVKSEINDYRELLITLNVAQKNGRDTLLSLRDEFGKQRNAYSTLEAAIRSNLKALDLNTASIAQLQKRAADLNTEYKNLNRAEADQAARMREIEAEYKSVINVTTSLAQITKQATKAANEAVGSYNYLAKQTAELREQLKSQADAFDTTTGKINKHNQAAVDLLARIQANDKALKSMSASMGQHQLKVGSYSEAIAGFGRNLLQSLGSVIGVTSAFEAATAMLGVISNMERLDAGLKAVSRDTDDFVRSQRFLIKTADDLGIKYESLVKSYKLLKAATKDTSLEGATTNYIFHAVSEAGARLGLSLEEVEGALMALVQMITKGQVKAEELKNQLGDRLPGALRIMAEATGHSVGELDKMMEKGQLLATDVLPKFAKELDKVYGGDAQGKVDTMTAGWNRMVNELNLLINAFNENKKVSTFFGEIANGIAGVFSDLRVLVQSNEWGLFMQYFTGNGGVAKMQAGVIQATQDAINKANEDFRALPVEQRNKRTGALFSKKINLERQLNDLTKLPYSAENTAKEIALEKELNKTKAAYNNLSKISNDQSKEELRLAKAKNKENEEQKKRQQEEQEKERSKAQRKADRALAIELGVTQSTTGDKLANLSSQHQAGLIDEQAFIEQRLKVTLEGLQKREALLLKYGKKETDDYINIQKEKKKADAEYLHDQLQLDLKNNKSNTEKTLAGLDRQHSEGDLTDIAYTDKRHEVIVNSIKAEQAILKEAGQQESTLYKETYTRLQEEQSDYLDRRLAVLKKSWHDTQELTKDNLKAIDQQTVNEYESQIAEIHKFYNKQREVVETAFSRGKISSTERENELHLINTNELKDELTAYQASIQKAKSLTSDYIGNRIRQLENLRDYSNASEREIVEYQKQIDKLKQILRESDAEDAKKTQNKVTENAKKNSDEELDHKKKNLEEERRLRDEAFSLIGKPVDGAFNIPGLADSAKAVMSIYTMIHNHKERLAEQEKMSEEDRKKAQLADLQEVAQATAAIGLSIVNTSYQLQQQRTTQQLNEIDKREQYELESVGNNEAAKSAIQKKFDAQRKALQRQQDIAARERAIYEIAINTAVAVAKALPDVPLSILIGALGLAQIIATQSQPLPQYFTGKNIDGITNDNYSGPAIVGERGRELWQHDGITELVDKPSLINVGANDIIYPNATTEQMLEGNAIAGRAKRQQQMTRQLASDREQYQVKLYSRAISLDGSTIERLGKVFGKANEELPYNFSSVDERGVVNMFIKKGTRVNDRTKKHRPGR